MKKLLTSLLVALLLCIVGFGSVSAEENYTYTIEFDNGMYGVITDLNGNPVSEIKDIDPKLGPTFVPSNYRVEVTNPKYYFKGFHISGIMDEYDNGVFKPLGTIPVDKDLIIVATYGVSGSLKEYHVRYVDQDGYELLPTDHFYGNVGDKPVVAYRYIAGYTPNTYNYTGTIPADDTVLTFTFVYTINRTTVYEDVEGDPLIVYTRPNRVGPTTTTEEPTEDEGTEVIEEIIEYVEPEPVIDVDTQPEPTVEPEPEEEKTFLETIGDMIAPLTNWISNTMESNPVLGVAAIIGISLLVIGILGLLLFLILLLIKRRKKNDERQPEAA